MRWKFWAKPDGPSSGEQQAGVSPEPAPRQSADASGASTGPGALQQAGTPAGSVAVQSGGATTGPVAVQREGGRGWAHLPPLLPTVRREAPLVVGEPPIQPPLSALRPSTTVEHEAIGRVEGLATALPLPEVAPIAAPLPPPPAPRRLRAVTPTEQPPLTSATDDYVGEAREPVEPHRAPGWLRHIPDWMKPDAPPAIPSNLPTVLPPPEPPPLITPPRIAEQPDTPTPPPAHPTRRRPSLGQTRRLGLGAPLSTPETTPDPTPEPQQPPPNRTGFPYTMDGLRKHQPPTNPPNPSESAPNPHQAAPTTPWGDGPRPVYRPHQGAEGVTGRLWTTSSPLAGERPSLAEALAFALPDQGEVERREAGPPGLSHPTASEPPPAPPQAADVVRAEGRAADGTGAPRQAGGQDGGSQGENDQDGDGQGGGVREVASPQDVAREVSGAVGTDVTDVPVYRGPAVDAAARERGARAFARADAVFLPDAAGPVTGAKARALIAHELVHVAQQRAHRRTPDAASQEGRRMEAEAVALERRYETTAAASPALHHPPRPTPAPAPEMAGPAQLARDAPDPAQSHFDTPAREEIVQLAEHSAERVIEEWSRPEPGRAGGFRSPATPAYDRATRRQEMEAEMLDEINADRLEAGEPLLSSLEPEHIERLENRLDREEITGERRGRSGRRSGGAAQTAPVVGGAFGDTVSFSETIGGTAQQQPQQQRVQQQRQRQAQQEREAITRLGLAAAITSQAERPERTQPELLPATEGGSFGDTTSFTERRGDDRYKGGRPPEDDSAGSDSARSDMHGSEQEPIDLDRLDLEDLTNRLYERLRGRLRLELLVDRERAGVLTDFR